MTMTNSVPRQPDDPFPPSHDAMSCRSRLKNNNREILLDASFCKHEGNLIGIFSF